jgi:hypothetical protein
MKIVINYDFGGFGLSQTALAEYRLRKSDNSLCELAIPRNDPDLVDIVERMGKEAQDRYSNLKIVEIPDGVQWEIQEYDGQEWIAEQHRTWR